MYNDESRIWEPEKKLKLLTPTSLLGNKEPEKS